MLPAFSQWQWLRKNMDLRFWLIVGTGFAPVFGNQLDWFINAVITQGAIMNTRNCIQVQGKARQRSIPARLALALAIPAFALSACYVIPIDHEGRPYYPAGASAPAQTYPNSATPAYVYSGAAIPAVLNVRLYPANDVATQTGMMTGTVTNMMSGKGRFQFDYRGEVLSGEATRVAGDERRGVASAYGAHGTYVSCEYQMSTPQRGAGTCSFNNGARYQVHIGS
jgi:hypothetical protein